ncbi:MAG: Thioredoxin-like [Segetibacter sp.]|nr:Thioredoxin-like [Segetibacter sp.]
MYISCQNFSVFIITDAYFNKKNCDDLHQLEKKLQDNKDFKLLSISIDVSKQVWAKNAILTLKPPGLGLREGEDKHFRRAYNIDLIPVLVLLDKKGNFIDFNPPELVKAESCTN